MFPEDLSATGIRCHARDGFQGILRALLLTHFSLRPIRNARPQRFPGRRSPARAGEAGNGLTIQGLNDSQIFCNAGQNFPKEKVKAGMSSYSENSPKAKTMKGTQEMKHRNMKQLVRLKSTIAPSVTGSIRCPPLSRVSLFVPLLLALWPSLASSQSITTVDVPGADSTSVSDINNLGTVAGSYTGGPNGGFHGFVRSRGGVITTFDPPGSISTEVEAINQEGTVTGSYFAPGEPYGFVISHGFV